MTPFNRRDWPRLPDWLDPHDGRRSLREINREALERCCLVLAFCVCFASLVPVPLMPFAFAGLLFLAGMHPSALPSGAGTGR